MWVCGQVSIWERHWFQMEWQQIKTGALKAGLSFDSLLKRFFLISSNKLGILYLIYEKTFRDIHVMIFMYYKAIYFCSLNIYLGSHKVKTIMLQCCYFAVAGWQCYDYVACSLIVMTAELFLIHCIKCWKKKDSIEFYSMQWMNEFIRILSVYR